jgi:hypothetical protein
VIVPDKSWTVRQLLDFAEKRKIIVRGVDRNKRELLERILADMRGENR